MKKDLCWIQIDPNGRITSATHEDADRVCVTITKLGAVTHIEISQEVSPTQSQSSDSVSRTKVTPS